MKMMKTLSLLTALSAVPVANAASVEDFHDSGLLTAADIGGGTSFSLNFNPVTEFSAAGHDKLIVTVSTHDGNTAGNVLVDSITYDGVALTEIEYATDNGQIVTSGIYYLDNVVTDGTLQIDLTGSTSSIENAAIGLLAVDGLQAGFATSATGRNPLPSVTLPSSDGFIVQQATRNNQSLGNTPDPNYTVLFNYTASVNNIPDDPETPEDETQNFAHRTNAQYGFVSGTPNVTTYAPDIANGGANFRMVAIAGFEVVPEPSSLALLGLGTLLIARRRRG